MSRKAADETLQNVFLACNKAPNSVSLERLVIRSLIKSTFSTVCMIICHIFLILVIFSPLAFVEKGFRVDRAMSADVAIVNHMLYEDKFVIVVSGDDMKKNDIYGKLRDSTLIKPEDISANDDGTYTVVFPYHNEDFAIYIPTSSGGTIKAVLSKY